MKKMITILAVTFTATAFMAFAEPSIPTARDVNNLNRDARTAELWTEKFAYKFSRGLVNLATCWVEIPRCMYVRTTTTPIIGPITGLFQGIPMTLLRAGGGVYDVATIGTVDDFYSPYNMYNYTEYVWQDWENLERKNR